MRPHAGVVPVMDDGVVRPQLEVPDRRRERDRPDVPDIGNRVADGDEVPQVPVAAGDEHRDPKGERGPEAGSAWRDHDHADGKGGDGRQKGQLYARRKARGDSGNDEGAGAYLVTGRQVVAVDV